MKRKRAESGEAETACPFLDLLLEDEIMVRIFSLLGNGITCLRTHSRVCKRFRSLMKNPLLWEQEIRIGAPKKFFATDLQMISPEISAYPVRSLHLSMVSEAVPSTIALTRSLFSLRLTLRLLIVDFNSYETFPIALLVGHLTGLTRLVLNAVPGIDEDDPGLYHYDILFDGEELGDLSESLAQLKRLESLVLSSIPIRQSTLDTILTTNHLTSFEFSGDNGIFHHHYDLSHLMLSLSNTSQLTHLDISKGIERDGQSRWTHTTQTSSALTSLTKLKSLKIRLDEVEASCFFYWIRNLPALRTVEIDKLMSGGWVDERREAPSNLTQLKLLNISADLRLLVSRWLTSLSSLTKLETGFVDFFNT